PPSRSAKFDLRWHKMPRMLRLQLEHLILYDRQKARSYNMRFPRRSPQHRAGAGRAEPGGVRQYRSADGIGVSLARRNRDGDGVPAADQDDGRGLHSPAPGLA